MLLLATLDPLEESQPTMDHIEYSQVKIEEDEDDYEEEENGFYEETNPNFEDTLGAFKTDNPAGNRWQRRFIHISDKMSKFRKTVETVFLVHGWKTPARTEPMTLIIINVSLSCHAKIKKFRFQSVRMWLAFYEDDKASPPNTEEASPEVVAYAPFVEQEIWNEAEEKIDETTTYGANVGAEQFAKVGADAKKETKRSYTRMHFDRGTADPLVANDKMYGVNWFCEQNDLQKYGVKPNFHIAVLLKRSHTKADNKPISFSAVFDMRIEAGLIHDFNEGRRRVFRLGKPEDEALYYDPNMDDQVYVPEGFVESIKESVIESVKKKAKKAKENPGELKENPGELKENLGDLKENLGDLKDNLGELMDGNHLSKLLDPTGALSGLEPIAPKKA